MHLCYVPETPTTLGKQIAFPITLLVKALSLYIIARGCDKRSMTCHYRSAETLKENLPCRFLRYYAILMIYLQGFTSSYMPVKRFANMLKLRSKTAIRPRAKQYDDLKSFVSENIIFKRIRPSRRQWALSRLY